MFVFKIKKKSTGMLIKYEADYLPKLPPFIGYYYILLPAETAGVTCKIHLHLIVGNEGVRQQK